MLVASRLPALTSSGNSATLSRVAWARLCFILRHAWHGTLSRCYIPEWRHQVKKAGRQLKANAATDAPAAAAARVWCRRRHRDGHGQCRRRHLALSHACKTCNVCFSLADTTSCCSLRGYCRRRSYNRAKSARPLTAAASVDWHGDGRDCASGLCPSSAVKACGLRHAIPRKYGASQAKRSVGLTGCTAPT